MDFIGFPIKDIRSAALEKLAVLSAKSTPKKASLEKSVTPSFQLLLGGIKDNTVVTAPIRVDELEILYALCRSTPKIINETQAQILLSRFTHYLLESPIQNFLSNASFNTDDLTPWTKLSFELTSAIATLGTNIPSLKKEAIESFSKYLQSLQLSDLRSQLSFIGFIQGVSANVDIISVPLFNTIMSFFTIEFYDCVEHTISTVTEAEEIDLISSFVDYGLEYSSLFFIKLIGRFQVEYLKNVIHASSSETLMDHMLKTESIAYVIEDELLNVIKQIIKSQRLNESYISSSSDRVISSSILRRKTCYTIRSIALEIYALGFVTSFVEFEFVRSLVSHYLTDFLNAIEDGSPDALEMIHSNLLLNVFGSGALLSENDQSVGLELVKQYPNVVESIVMPRDFVKQLTNCLTCCMRSLSKDDIISSIYTLINMLNDTASFSGSEDGSIVANSYIVERNDLIPQNIVISILQITKAVNDESINTLVTTMLFQKIRPKSDEFNCILLDGLTEFVDTMQRREFRNLVRYFYDASESSIKERSNYKLNIDIWSRFSDSMLKRYDSELYTVYLEGLLSQIISKGDIDDLEHHRPDSVVTESASEIVAFLKPLAHLLPPTDQPPLIPKSKKTIHLFQNAWFNLAIHGFAYGSPLYKNNLLELTRIAHSTPALASESSWNRSETSIEMNTILRRGTSKTTEKLHKDTITPIFTSKAIDAKVFESQLSRPGLMFLSSTLLVETLRIRSGNCSTVLEYMSDPSVMIAKLQSFVGSITLFCCNRYIHNFIKGGNSVFTSSRLTEQLKEIFIYCCHRNSALQDCAFECADQILKNIPSALCYEKSAFSLLDILSLLFQSIIDADTNEYEPITTFKSKVTDIDLSLSDSYVWRQNTLDRFANHGARWVISSLTKCEYDMKTVLRSYVNKADASHRTINYGVSFALDMASKILPSDREFFQLQGIQSRKLNTTAGFLSQTPYKSSTKLLPDGFASVDIIIEELTRKVDARKRKFANTANKSSLHHEFTEIMEDITRVIILLPTTHADFVRWTVELPFMIFDSYSIEHAITSWLNIIKEKPEFSSVLLSSILLHFEKTVTSGIGLYSRERDLKDSKFNPMEYLPTNKKVVEHNSKLASTSFKPHLLLIRFFSSHFHATLFQSDHILKIFTNSFLVALRGLKSASLHPFARMARFELIFLCSELLYFHENLNTRSVSEITNTLLDGALSWFEKQATTPFGNNKLKIKADYEILLKVSQYFSFSSFKDPINEKKRAILLLFLDDERNTLHSWLNPLGGGGMSNHYAPYKLEEHVLHDAYVINGKLALNLVERYGRPSSLEKQLRSDITGDPFAVSEVPYAVYYAIDTDNPAIVAWAPAAPVDAVKYFMPPFNRNALVIQYAMRSIESFDVHLTFFYVPQIVQTLRHDDLDYIRRFILETANVSQLFAHQIIWNMAANSYKDEESTIPDSIKPTLDNIRETMIKEFSAKDRSFFEKEFSFFSEVTGISGKLKPYIKKSKPEKKAKIDEEMAAIKVEEGVYLPSNPDGVVIDIDRKSGKPLQSHAKAPFMATFIIKKQKEFTGEETNNSEDEQYEIVKTSAIFKVGDDCRQDVLALQLISMFRTIWMTAGVDVYVFPYRVTATAPGCGIIDVLPNSISRDMLGREAVNGLYEYFITQFGPETSPEFQRARNNFVKSLAAYSIITYLLAIKDRHNGNIMYDNNGYILHIDFGFCFDIVPGGVKFEQSPFKLTREMVRVMGGSSSTQAYKWFEELCVKCFLACRTHMDAIIGMVTPMLESGLPCFKPATIKHLHARFVPNKSDKDASIYIRGLIKKSFESFATKGYDEFQRITNGIPY